MTTILPSTIPTTFSKLRESILVVFFALAAISFSKAQTCPSGNIVYVNANASGNTQDGTSWATAFTTLQDALYITQTCSSSKQVWVAKGTYYPTTTFQLKNNLAIYGGFNGTEASLGRRNFAVNITVLSSDINKDNKPDDGDAGTVTTGSGTDNTAILDGFTVTGGYSDRAGGMINISGSPTVSNCIFSGNYANYDGSGMYNENSSPVITNCTFSGNTAGRGGGIANEENSNPVITNCIFSGNTAALGGGIINDYSNPVITNCIFSGNSISSYGGAICNFENSSAVITNCIFSGNSTTALGGGISNEYNSNAVITNCIFSGNSAIYGAGMYNANSSPDIRNCTFSGNSATGEGGGGMENYYSTPVITNCIFWNNKTASSIPQLSAIGTADASIHNGASAPTITYSLVQGQTPSGTGNLDGTNAANNPQFVTSLNPDAAPSTGGDFHLQRGSPAINAGTNTEAPFTDIENNPRALTAADPDDIGAYEKQVIHCPSGNIVYVNSTVSAGTHDGASWTRAFVTLQAALEAAGICSNVQQIWVAKGTYYGTFQLKNGIAIYGGFAGTETTLDSRNFANNIVVLSGDIDKNNNPDAGNAINVINGSGTDNTAVLDGFTITGGYSAGNTGYGGGMINTSGSPTVSNCIFSANTAGFNGGGMYNNKGSSPVVTNCIFSGNSSSFDGGGMFNSSNSNPLITNCTFSGNSASSTGGAIYNLTSSPVITNCIIWNNEDESGTGTPGASIYSFQSSVKIIYSLVQGQAASGPDNDLDGTNSANDPMFETPVDPAIAPTAVGDLHLKCFSPAIDAGNNNADYVTTTDLDGKPRIINGAIDLGAYEKQEACIQATTTTIATSGSPSCQGSSVTFTATILIKGNTNTPATTGGVIFTQGTTVLSNSVPVNSNGQAAFSTNTLGAGSYAIVAAYQPPSTAFAASNGSVTQVVNARPTGTLSGGGTYCSGTSTTTDLTINVTGSGTVSGTLSGNIQFSGTAPVIHVLVSPAVSTTYMITSLMDANCNALSTDFHGSAMVTINPSPTVAAISGSNQLIKGCSIQLSNATKGGIWSSSDKNVASVSSTGLVKGISAGNCFIYYKVTSGSCSATGSKTITVYNPLTATVTRGKITCYGGTTTLTINASGGPGGYKYSLNGSKFQTSNTFTVTAGIYIIIITDQMANQFTLKGVIITQPVPLAVKLTKETNASSKTGANGSFTVSGYGGTPAYQYSKNSGASYQSSGTFSNLTSGSYKVSIKDANSCVALNYLTINVAYGRQNLSLANETLISDAGNEDAKITASVYPNPAETGFNLQLKSSKDETIEIRVTDILGRAIYRTRGNATGLYKFGERFTPGMYMVEVIYKEGMRTLKVIKQ